MIKRVFLATINYDHPQRGLTHAFESIFGRSNVLDFDYVKICEWNNGPGESNRRFLEEAKAFKPDWIFLQLQMTKIIRAQTIMEVRAALPKAVVSHWMGDCRRTIDPYLVDICKATHITMLSNKGQRQQFLDAGAQRFRYVQIGIDLEEDAMGVPEWTPPFRVPDVVLLGNHYGETYPGTVDRERAIQTLIDAGIDVGVIGSGWPTKLRPVGACHVKQQFHVWSRAKVGLCVNNFNDVELHYSDRQIISMASGTPIVCYEVPGLKTEFEDGVDCLMYRDQETLVRHVKALLADPTLRNRIGAAGRARVMRDHTWWNRIFDILPVMEEIRETL